MAGNNGTAGAEQAAIVTALDLEDIAYERVPVRVTILGQRYVFDAWVRGPGCPGRISSEFARRRKLMSESFQQNGGAYQDFLTDGLRTIFEAPANQYEAIDLLAGDEARAEKILRHTKWMQPLVTTAEGAADPEATGEGEQTTPTSSPTSLVVTGALARTAAAG